MFQVPEMLMGLNMSSLGTGVITEAPSETPRREHISVPSRYKNGNPRQMHVPLGTFDRDVPTTCDLALYLRWSFLLALRVVRMENSTIKHLDLGAQLSMLAQTST